MLRFIALQGIRAHENVELSQRRENITYRDRSRVVELLLRQIEKQTTNHAKSCGVSTKAHVFVIY